MNVQLFVKNQTNNQFINLDLFGSEPIKLTLSVANIQDPLAANSVFSRTFRVPHTSINGPYFKAVFNVNSTDFDASIKAPAYINDNGVFFASGNIRLSAIFVNERTNNVEYEINFYGETSDFGSKIGGGFLNEVDMSSYNHNQTTSNIINSWSNGLFNGDIIYPAIEWGYSYNNNIPTAGTWSRYQPGVSEKGTFGPISSPPPQANAIKKSQFKPSIRVKALWDKIFTEAGYKYTSTFLDSTEFKSLYVVAEDKARAELLANQEFGADSTVSQSNLSGATHDVFFNNELFDNSNQYSPVTSIFQAGATGIYSFRFFAFLIGYEIPPLRSVGAWGQLVDADTGTILATTGTPVNILRPPLIGPSATSLTNFFTVSLNANQRVRIRILYSSLNPPDANVNIELFGQSLDLISAPENVNISSVMPSNIRKIDFMRSVINRFRLVFVPSKENENEFEITPWKDWILQGNSLDWTSKLDGSKDMVIKPLFYGQERLQVYKDQEDADFVNYNYQLAFKQTYGQLNLDSNNELIKGTKITQDQFAPTPLFPMGNVTPTDPLYKIVFPHLAKDTNTERQPIQPKLRLVHYNGLQPVPGANQWWLETDFGAPSARTSYPLVSQYSTWPVNNNTFDLAWENEPPLYNTDSSGLPPARTSFDCFNVYWKTWYDVIFDPFSRIVEAHFVLSWSDVVNLKFNDYIFVKDSWYFVNKVTDYIAGQDTNCKVELIKIGNNIGIVLPINIPTSFNAANLCFSNLSKCDAFCCFDGVGQGLYYINSFTLETASFIYSDEFGSIPAPTGFYSDGTTIVQVGASGNIIAVLEDDCDCDRESYAFEVCPSSLITEDPFCEACCCANEPITIYGADANFFNNLYFFSDMSLTVPAPNGYYKLSDGLSPTSAYLIENGVVVLAGLCELDNGCGDPGCTSYRLFSSTGGGVCFTPCGSEFDICVDLNPGVPITICAETGTAYVAVGSASITEQSNFTPLCDCDGSVIYNPWVVKYSEVLCDACCEGTDVTIWVEDGFTPATTINYYADSLGSAAAAPGYYKFDNDVYLVDNSGVVILVSSCDSCECLYFYSAQNCQELLLQTFSYPTPLPIGTVVSSNFFAGQCWTIIDTALDGFPIDIIYENCETCLGITNPCECQEYSVSVGESGGAVQYLNCATQEVNYLDIIPGTAQLICACNDSLIPLTGGVSIALIGPCEPSGCLIYELYTESPLGATISFVPCGGVETSIINIDPLAVYQICAENGTVAVDVGTAEITEGAPC